MESQTVESAGIVFNSGNNRLWKIEQAYPLGKPLR